MRIQAIDSCLYLNHCFHWIDQCKLQNTLKTIKVAAISVQLKAYLIENFKKQKNFLKNFEKNLGETGYKICLIMTNG